MVKRLETLFAELKRYVRFDDADGAALRGLAPRIRLHYKRIVDAFYQRLSEHEAARRVFTGPEQVERLKQTLTTWLEEMLTGPWDEDYYGRRSRIGRMHVRVGLPQRYMFTAMEHIRGELLELALVGSGDDPEGARRSARALGKVTDLELTIMLETYGEAFISQIQAAERQEKGELVARLAVTEARYQQIVEKSEALIATADAHGRALLWNARCEQLTGVPREQALGRDLFELVVPESARKAVRAHLAEVLASGRPAHFEEDLPGPRACRVRWHLTTLPSGAEPLLCLMGLDVTGELELTERTHRSERLASLGTLAAGLAHEIRNPLNAAVLQLAVVQRRLARSEGADVPAAKAAAEVVAAEMARLAALVQEFLQFARPQPLRLTETDVAALASSVVALLRPEASSRGVALTLTADSGALANLDAERFKQVLINLVRNAIEAADTGGSVQVRVAGQGRKVTVEVEDDGPGVPTDAPIFEPFFTTKEGGTGLGLSIVHRIVTDHGGHIGVSSQPGRTTFSVALLARAV